MTKFKLPKFEESDDYEMFALTLTLVNKEDRAMVDKMCRALYYRGVSDTMKMTMELVKLPMGEKLELLKKITEENAKIKDN